MSIETLSLVMIFCDGMFIVIVRKVTRVICSRTGMRIIKPGPRTPVYLPKKKMTPRSYSFTTRSERDTSTTTIASTIMILGMVFYSLEDESPLASPEYRATRPRVELFVLLGVTHVLGRGRRRRRSGQQTEDRCVEKSFILARFLCGRFTGRRRRGVDSGRPSGISRTWTRTSPPSRIRTQQQSISHAHSRDRGCHQGQLRRIRFPPRRWLRRGTDGHAP